MKIKAAAVAEYLAEVGKRGGLVRSKAKARAARANGKKGGRPRKPVDPRVQCSALRSSYRGNVDIGSDMRCLNWAIHGSTFCRHHTPKPALMHFHPMGCGVLHMATNVAELVTCPKCKAIMEHGFWAPGLTHAERSALVKRSHRR